MTLTQISLHLPSKNNIKRISQFAQFLPITQCSAPSVSCGCMNTLSRWAPIADSHPLPTPPAAIALITHTSSALLSLGPGETAPHNVEAPENNFWLAKDLISSSLLGGLTQWYFYSLGN